MFTAKQIDRYADILIWGLTTARKKKFKKNDLVLIRFHHPALLLAEVLYDKLLRMGLTPVHRMETTPAMEHSYYQNATPAQLTVRFPGDKELFENLNGYIFLHAPESITHLRDIDPARIGKVAVARKYLRDILDAREEKGLFGWTLCSLPTEEQARHARLPLKDYTRQIVSACFLNKKSPVAQWQQIYRDAIAIKKWLKSLRIQSLRVESASMDLEVSLGEKRKWVGLSGHNLPSFELFTSPDWRGTQGVYFADQPSFRSGNYVEGVRLEFKNGSVVKATAQTGEAFVKKQLAMDPGARRLGEFSLTDKRFSKINAFMANTLYDENYGGRFGNCHVAVGSSYSDAFDGDPAKLTPEIKKSLGFNSSALHWDLVNTEKKRVTATATGGKPVVIYENGKFLY
ncbi:MAG: aminopeptidase [Desulfobacterales bacterium]|nr:aminopeptidase [Desulfobacterales bacterium]